MRGDKASGTLNGGSGFTLSEDLCEPSLDAMYTPKVTILLAEDSDDDAFFFERALKKVGAGYPFVRAGNGKAAIEMVSAGAASPAHPFLIFLDLKMPIMSGFDVLTWLASAKMDAKPRVLVLSGSNDQADRARAFSLGAADYLVKPITADVLRAKINEGMAPSDPPAPEMGAPN